MMRAWWIAGRERWVALLPWVVIPLAVWWTYRGVLGLFFENRDDWQLLGPPAASLLVEHPVSLFTRMQGPHYAPVAGAWYGLISLLFGTDPLPYHASNLALLSLAGILLFSLLKTWGVSPLPALAGALIGTLPSSHIHVVYWITASNYLLCSIFLFSTLLFLERYMKKEGGGRMRWLALGLIFCLLGQWTHSLGILIPIMAGNPSLFRPGGPGGRGRLGVPG